MQHAPAQVVQDYEACSRARPIEIGRRPPRRNSTRPWHHRPGACRIGPRSRSDCSPPPCRASGGRSACASAQCAPNRARGRPMIAPSRRAGHILSPATTHESRSCGDTVPSALHRPHGRPVNSWLAQVESLSASLPEWCLGPAHHGAGSGSTSRWSVRYTQDSTRMGSGWVARTKRNAPLRERRPGDAISGGYPAVRRSIIVDRSGRQGVEANRFGPTEGDGQCRFG